MRALVLVLGLTLCASASAQVQCQGKPDSVSLEDYQQASVGDYHFIRKWLDISDVKYGRCPKSMDNVAYALQALKPYSPLHWGGYYTVCDYTSPVAKAISGAFAMALAAPKGRRPTDLGDQTGDLLRRSLPDYYQMIVSTEGKCSGEKAVARIKRGRVSLGASFFWSKWTKTPVDKAIVLVHELAHLTAGPHDNSDCYGAKEGVGETTPLCQNNNCCDATWGLTPSTWTTFQIEILWTSLWLTDSDYLDQLRETNPTYAQEMWDRILKQAKKRLSYSFRDYPCVRFLDTGALDYSRCDLADGVGDIDLPPGPIDIGLPEDICNRPPNCASPPPVEPDPDEPEPDPCEDDRNWRRERNDDGYCTAYICEGLNETRIDWDSEKCDPRTCKIQGCDVEYPYEEECPLGCFTSESCDDWEPDPCECLERCLEWAEIDLGI